MSDISWQPKATPANVAPGTPCWIELATTDATAAIRFYSALFGWRCVTNADPATGTYTIASLAGAQVAGLHQQPGPGSAWMIYLSVYNTRTAAERVEQLGGRVTLGPVDIPRRGSILHLTDPGGTPLALWQLAPSWKFTMSQPGTFTSADLNTHDARHTDRFYRLLFDFHQSQIGDGMNYDYAEWQLAGRPVLYRYVMGNEYRRDTPAHWMIYFAATAGYTVDELARRAIALGGTAPYSPYDSYFGRIATLVDPTGASFSVIDHSTRAPDHGSPNDDPYDD